MPPMGWTRPQPTLISKQILKLSKAFQSEENSKPMKSLSAIKLIVFDFAFLYDIKILKLLSNNLIYRHMLIFTKIYLFIPDVVTLLHR